MTSVWILMIVLLVPQPEPEDWYVHSVKITAPVAKGFQARDECEKRARIINRERRFNIAEARAVCLRAEMPTEVVRRKG